MAEDEPFLEVGGLRAGYGTLQILRDISFSVARGEVVGFFGRNGAGKTTLMEVLAGLLPAKAGTVRLDGRTISGRPAHTVARARVALVPQWRGLFPGLSVEDNLRLGCRGIGLSRAEVSKRLEQVLEQYPGLGSRRTVDAGSLSGGEAQLLAISKALIRDPVVLMLDEPSIGLAPIIVEQVASTISALRSSERIILLTEQRTDWSLDVIDRGFVIESGAFSSRLDSDDRANWQETVADVLGSRLSGRGR